MTTNPPGAACSVSRDGNQIGIVNPTPGSLHVDKSRHDLVVRCAKDGFAAAQMTAQSSFVATTFGNILLGGVIGAGVDLATGADYQYHDVNVQLTPVAAPIASPGTATPLAANLPPTS